MDYSIRDLMDSYLVWCLYTPSVLLREGNEMPVNGYGMLRINVPSMAGGHSAPKMRRKRWPTRVKKLGFFFLGVCAGAGVTAAGAAATSWGAAAAAVSSAL